MDADVKKKALQALAPQIFAAAFPALQTATQQLLGAAQAFAQGINLVLLLSKKKIKTSFTCVLIIFPFR